MLHSKNYESFIVLGLSTGQARVRLSVDHDETIPWSAVLKTDITAIAVLSGDVEQIFMNSISSLLIDLDCCKNGVIVLLPWRLPPVSGMRYDGQVVSFLCTADLFNTFLLCNPDQYLSQLCFRLLSLILSRTLFVDRILIRQLPYSPCYKAFSPLSERIALIMPHRGNPMHLEAALDSIQRSTCLHLLSVRIGLDEERPEQYRTILRRFPHFTFYYINPAPAGHFVVKQALVGHSTEPFISFHDSDDLSCDDRITVSLNELHRTGCDLVGCHELRVDEINGFVEAYRVPLDVCRALECNQTGALLHATTVVLRERFLQTGGLSTDQKIASDTQFKLRAYFSLSMRNTDNFLYIRRRHHNALTVRPDTALGTELRQRLRSAWGKRFRSREKRDT